MQFKGSADEWTSLVAKLFLVKVWAGKRLSCYRCHWEWTAKNPWRPKLCPGCRSSGWWFPKFYMNRVPFMKPARIRNKAKQNAERNACYAKSVAKGYKWAITGGKKGPYKKTQPKM